MSRTKKHFLWFKEVDKADIEIVGGKGANLGEMASFGIPVPRGFIVTSQAYYDFLDANHLIPKIKENLKALDLDDPTSFSQASGKIKKLILKAEIPKEISRGIIDRYIQMGKVLRHALVAVRSSATAEDLPDASFAGQQATFLNVAGEASVVQAVKDCWASLFEPRAIFYRQDKGFDHLKVGMAVPVQEMVPAAISGVMFTIDPVNNDKQSLVIEAIYGLGEYIVQGVVIPDRYLIQKKPLKIINIDVAKQTRQLIKSKSANKEAPVPKKLQLKRKLTNPQIRKLAKLGLKIHRHYYFPQDIEWAFYQGKFWIVQTRPVTTIKETKKAKTADVTKGRKPILKGIAASPGIASGPVRIIHSAKKISQIKNGDILVTGMTTPDFVPAMKKASAIVTDKGGLTSHAAIVSRELGTPCVVGTKKATKLFKNKQLITINGQSGEVFEGGFESRESLVIKGKSKTKVKSSLTEEIRRIKTATKVYVNLGEPQLAETVAQANSDGVGLLRAEFMMAEIGTHPKKIIKEKKQKQFIDQLTDNLAVFCRAFEPRPVVYRTTDFKTNEYRHLTGGHQFEPEEENPLLGFRGAFRYLVNDDVFELELKAIQKVREKMGLKNLWMMVPFCRTPRELKEVKKIIVANGLIRGPSFKLWLMVEIPSNVILLEEFAKVGIDGVSIGSNDLTMLILGVDRDNPDLAETFKEDDPAVLWALEKTLKTCHDLKISASICGQAASTSPDLVEKLIQWGITSVSVNPDALESTRQMVYQTEKRIAQKNG
jgi:pyruvate,water dikinase